MLSRVKIIVTTVLAGLGLYLGFRHGNISQSASHISNDSLAMWYQAILNRYNSTSNANNSIDNKSSVILAVTAAIAVFGAERLAEHGGVLGIVGLGGLVAAGAIIIFNTNLKDVSGEVNTSDEHPEYYRKDDHAFLLHLVSDVEMSLTRVSSINLQKAKLYSFSVIIFGLASVILLISVFWDFNLSLQIISRS